MLPEHGHGGACVSVHSCRRNPFVRVAFMFAYSVRNTLDWRTCLDDLCRDTVSTACNKHLWLDLIYPFNCPSGVWSVGLPQLLLSFSGQAVTIQAAR